MLENDHDKDFPVFSEGDLGMVPKDKDSEFTSSNAKVSWFGDVP